jgi:DNA polymerase-2
VQTNNTYRGWLLDVYADKQDGAVIWLVGEKGKRHRFTQTLPVSFFVAGPDEMLRGLWGLLQKQNIPLHLSRVSRKELFDGNIDVLEVRIENPALQPRIFRLSHERFPDLDYYNANIPFAIRYHAAFNLFPLAFCTIEANVAGEILRIETSDERWDINPKLPPLRILALQPNTNPGQFAPSLIKASHNNQRESISTADPAELLRQVSHLIEQYDPDIIATEYGDKWLFPYLFAIARKTHFSFNPNRDKSKRAIQIKESTFTSYGRVVHRDQQTLLLGRVHIDGQNSMLFKDHGLFGFCQQARITGLPLQKAVRRSPGGGFTGMQIRTALENDILIPVNKKQRERFKTVAQLLSADRGGIIYQPTTGLHRDVAEIDFFSMYPSLMEKWNVSAETVGREGANTFIVPGIDRPITQDNKGIVPAILGPLLDARHNAVDRMKATKKTEEIARMETISDTLKGLGWVSYGYQGFSGNRIGSIEAHEAINAISRELILRAKEVAEGEGFSILHMYVDSLFIQKQGADQPEDYMALIKEMGDQAEIPLKLEGIFRWIAFLPSKQDGDIPVPNCFYGVFQNGKIKRRGIMARREDTPLFLKEIQLRAIELFAQEVEFDRLPLHIPKVIHYLSEQYRQLLRGEIPLSQLKIARTLSKDLLDYRVPSAPARAAAMLAKVGKRLGAGQTVEYLHLSGKPDVIPWDLSTEKQLGNLDYVFYRKLFFRAAEEILTPFGIDQRELITWLEDKAGYFLPEDYVSTKKKDLPLFEFGRPKLGAKSRLARLSI